MTQSPSGIPAQTACRTDPRIVAVRARIAAISRSTPLVPRTSIRTNPVRNVPRMLPTMPQA